MVPTLSFGQAGVLWGTSLISGAGVGSYRRLLVPQLGVHRTTVAML